MIRNATVNIFAPLKIVSLDKFLESIPIKEIRDMYIVQYNSMEYRDNEDAVYRRNYTELKDGDRKTILKSQLLSKIGYNFIERGKVMELAHDLVTEYLEHFGNPTHLVRINRRSWMVANPSDFSVFVSDSGVGLAVYNTDRAKIRKVIG